MKECCQPSGVEPATSWSPVGRASNWAKEATFLMEKKKLPYLELTISGFGKICHIVHIYELWWKVQMQMSMKIICANYRLILLTQQKFVVKNLGDNNNVLSNYNGKSKL